MRRRRRDVTISGDGISTNVVPTEPRFVSEAYFMDFKFEPGNYYLAGREELEGQKVLKIEYYPTNMFKDDDTPEEKQEGSRAEGRGRDLAQDEQDRAGHAVGRSVQPPDREVHLRQRVARLPARRLARPRRQHARIDDDVPAVRGGVAAARHGDLGRRHARQRVLRGRLHPRLRRLPPGRRQVEDPHPEARRRQTGDTRPNANC